MTRSSSPVTETFAVANTRLVIRLAAAAVYGLPSSGPTAVASQSSLSV